MLVDAPASAVYGDTFDATVQYCNNSAVAQSNMKLDIAYASTWAYISEIDSPA